MSEEPKDALEAASGNGLTVREKGRAALTRVFDKAVAISEGEWRGSANCPNCKAVLMSGTMLPPGLHRQTCAVCNLSWDVEVSGGTVTAIAAMVASIGDATADWLNDFARRATQRRAELLGAIERGEVSDPFTATVFGSVFLAHLLGAVAISAVVSVGTAFLTRALTPRQKFTTGQLQGTLQVPQSDQGLQIVEGYGADPASKASAFQASHAYALEDWVVSGGYFYVVTTAGTSASSAPTFPTAKGASVTSGSAVFTNYGRTGGGFKLPMLIVWTSGIRKHVTKTTVKSGGKGPKPAEQTEISYDLDLAVMPGRGPLNVKRIKANTDTIYQNFQPGPTGVPDPDIDPDPPYDPGLPPDANLHYTRPTERFSGTLTPDGTGARTGTIQAGSYANVATYPGNAEQLPDPTMQGAVDAQFGADSTPAYRDRCLIVLRNFFLTPYGGAIPLISTLAEHQTIDTLELLYAHLSSRVGVLTSADYDYSGVRRMFLRGLPITPPFNPADVMEEVARIYNVYFTEDTKIRAFERGSQAPVAILTSADLGWVEGDTELNETDELPSLDFDIATETEIARRYEITAVDPDRDFEQNSQGTSRQITSSEKTEKIELALTLYSEEMREVTQRELYEEEAESTKYPDFGLDWSYLWASAGDTLVINEADGTTSTVFIDTIKPNVGVIPVSGTALETAVYSQPVSTTYGVFEVPPVPIPGMTLVGFYDGPLLLDAWADINNGAGVVAWAVKRRGDGDFTGSALFVDRGLGSEGPIAVFDKQATAGVTASDLAPSTNLHTFTADALTVDLYPDDDTLESVTTEDLLRLANVCIVGDEVCQILTATREPDTATYANRWYLTIGRRGLRGTAADAAEGTPSGARFVLVDDALQFVPLNLSEIDRPRTYRMVTAGQSLDDAAAVEFAWAAESTRELAPLNFRAVKDSDGDTLIEFDPALRVGGTLRDYRASGRHDAEFELQLTDASYNPLDREPLVIIPGMGIPLAVIDTSVTGRAQAANKGVHAVPGSSTSTGVSVQEMARTGNEVVATLLSNPNMVAGGWAGVGLLDATIDYRSATPAACRYYVEYNVPFEASAANGVLTVYEFGVSKAAVTPLAEGPRVRLLVNGSEVKVYVLDKVGAPPVYASALPPTFPLRAFMFTSGGSFGDLLGGAGQVKDARMTSGPKFQTLYSAAQRLHDYGSASATAYGLLYAVGGAVGKGHELKVSF